MADCTFDVFSSVDDVERKSADGVLSIGCPIWNSIVYVVDDQGRGLCRQGEVGQICVSGLNVASKGYVDDEESGEHFATNWLLEEVEFSNSREARNHRIVYFTGDYGRIVNGKIIYEGRRDSQVHTRLFVF